MLACKVRMKIHTTDKPIAFPWGGGYSERRTPGKNLDIFTLISKTLIKIFTA